ncbi:hypothetical protein [Glutamicibacter protophormiae]|uniref:hypothetical protein n=1 Tax=Glutamicibacter protophormiae TaxID=37930 RepID=UPI00331F914B
MIDSEAASSPSAGCGILTALAGPPMVTANAKAVADPSSRRGNLFVRRVTMILLAELDSGDAPVSGRSIRQSGRAMMIVQGQMSAEASSP